jgi:hypothetical protein
VRAPVLRVSLEAPSPGSPGTAAVGFRLPTAVEESSLSAARARGAAAARAPGAPGRGILGAAAGLGAGTGAGGGTGAAATTGAAGVAGAGASEAAAAAGASEAAAPADAGASEFGVAVMSYSSLPARGAIWIR